MATSTSKIIRDIMASAPQGATFTGITQTLKGSERLAPGEKRGGLKVRYGDKRVCDVVVTGFNYRNLCERSADMLEATDANGLVISDEAVLDLIATKGRKAWQGRGDKAVEVPVTAADVQAARDELIASFRLSEEGLNESTTDHVYEPLTDKDGNVVKGGRVYTGPGDANDPKAPIPGTVYLQGLRVQRRVLADAPNGDLPESKSAPKSVAKDILRGLLPVGKYVSYALETGTDFRLAVGGAAVLESTTQGFLLTDELYNFLRAA
jgi:hypothetical protein